MYPCLKKKSNLRVDVYNRPNNRRKCMLMNILCDLETQFKNFAIGHFTYKTKSISFGRRGWIEDEYI